MKNCKHISELLKHNFKHGLTSLLREKRHAVVVGIAEKIRNTLQGNILLTLHYRQMPHNAPKPEPLTRGPMECLFSCS